LSSEIDCRGLDLTGLIVPTIDSAVLTFQVCDESGGTPKNLYKSDGTTEVQTPSAAFTGDKAIAAPVELVGWSFVKVRSGTAGTPVNQTATRTITVVLQDM